MKCALMVELICFFIFVLGSSNAVVNCKHMRGIAFLVSTAKSVKDLIGGVSRAGL
jgi:hypothetical protein